MHFSIRGIVKDKDKIILIHRKKRQKDKSIRDYYVVPGGKMEEGETEKETLIREIYEELGIKVNVKKLILEHYSKYNDSIQKFYECEYASGILGTGDGPEMYEKREKGELFEIVTLSKHEIKEINLVPQEIKDILLK